MGSKCFAIATRRCSVLSKSFVKIAIPGKERNQRLACKTGKHHSNIIKSPCAEDPEVKEGHNAGWGLCNATIRQYYTLKVLSEADTWTLRAVTWSTSHTLKRTQFP